MSQSPAPRQALGRQGEQRAAEYLAAKGYGLLARNWRSRAGELDLVARDGDWLVFVEVRTRRGTFLGTPEESVTPRKQARLVAAAQAYLAESGWAGLWRIDVLALQYALDGGLQRIHHLTDAVGGVP